MEKNTFYITTPIYYPSNKFTLGNCYTTIICDGIARWNRMLGKDVFYMTGTDEHGQKIEQKARDAGKTEMEYLNEMIADAKALWSLLDISYDKFIRTTDDYHEKGVQKIFNKLYEKGDIYKGKYKGMYCTPCESFWTNEQLVDGKCPDCGREVHEMEEEAYFFKLSKYQDKVQKLLEETDFLEPRSRVNEMVNNFIKPGLQDLCVSRTSVKWGVPVEFDPKHTIYVWIDALPNYLTGIGGFAGDEEKFNKYWPCDIHVVGKEIVRFHAIIWPAILMALDLPLPKKVYGHGWLLFGGDKLSKSKSSGLKDVNDPRILIERYGLDSVRLFIQKEINFGQDGNYTQELFLNTCNNALANQYGNLVSRTLGMIGKYLGGVIGSAKTPTEADAEFKKYVLERRNEAFENMSKYNISGALNAVFDIFDRGNKFIDENEPWTLSKAGNTARLNDLLCVLSEAIVIGSTLLMPFLTDKPKTVFERFGQTVPTLLDDYANFGFIKDNTTTTKGDNLYPRLDINKEMEELYAISENSALSAQK